MSHSSISIYAEILSFFELVFHLSTGCSQFPRISFSHPCAPIFNKVEVKHSSYNHNNTTFSWQLSPERPEAAKRMRFIKRVRELRHGNHRRVRILSSTGRLHVPMGSGSEDKAFEILPSPKRIVDHRTNQLHRLRSGEEDPEQHRRKPVVLILGGRRGHVSCLDVGEREPDGGRS